MYCFSTKLVSTRFLESQSLKVWFLKNPLGALTLEYQYSDNKGCRYWVTIIHKTMARNYSTPREMITGGTYSAEETLKMDKQFGQFIESRTGQVELSNEIMANFEMQFGDLLDGKRQVDASLPAVADMKGYTSVSIRPFQGQAYTPERIRERYKALEDANEHSANVVLMAETVGSKEDYDKAMQIFDKHKQAGELTPALQKEREAISSKLNGAFKNFLATGRGGPKRGAYNVVIPQLPSGVEIGKRLAAGEPASKIRAEYKRLTQLAVQEGRFDVSYIG